MPTPVTTAIQCLTEESTRALNDAVLIAKRRNHAQTTSLHIISSLLSPSFTLLRDSLTRARSSAYSPRLQLRALELCVSVSLDRVTSSKFHKENDDFTPPVSNSLMAAIKRSQAHQRRQPDMYHLTQINNYTKDDNNNTETNRICPTSINNNCVKVELKHFVLSILDDPIVSRVFGEAGFRSSDIKLAIINPPLPRWTPLNSNNNNKFTARCPPLFLCNFMDFSSSSNCKRISEITNNNPMLVGVCAKDALNKFKESVFLGRFDGFCNKFVCFEREIKERDIQGFDLKIEEVRSMVEIESSSNGGKKKVVVNLGDVICLVNCDDNDNDNNYVKDVVCKVSKLVQVYEKRVWLIGEVESYEIFSKFVGRFPSVEKDWDLQLLPITSSSSQSCSSGASSFDPKSRLMGSFVPFGGFFPTPSDFRAPLTAVRQAFTRCNACNESYERELGDTVREGSSVSVAGDQSSSLPSWLHRAESDPSESGDVVAQVKEVRNEKISCLQKKWDDHCRLAHQKYPFFSPPVSQAGLQIAQPLGFQLMSNIQATSHSSSGDSSLNERACSNSSSIVQNVAHNISPKNLVIKHDFPKGPLETPNMTLPLAHEPRSTVPVTTDLGLGMFYSSKLDEVKTPFQGALRNESKQIERLDLGDYKPLFRKLSEAVPWQSEAICKITEIVSRCKTDNTRGNVWLSFHGPDKIGQKRIAQALSEAIHGRRDQLIALNLNCQDRIMEYDSLSLCQGLNLKEFDINSSRITIVDHIAQELSRKPQSVVFLENVDEADPLLQNSLSRAIKTGRFPDSRGKEVGINNVVFVMTSRLTRLEKNLSPRKEFIKFVEEKISEAKNWEMQLAIRSVSSDACRSNEPTVSLLSPKCGSTKRKLSVDLDETRRDKKTKKSLDLNLSLEMDCYEGDLISDKSNAWLEDFFVQVDGNVTFKPFDFDALADTLLRKLRLKLEETLRPGQRVSLEIDHEVMLQILAAAWYADNKAAVEEWIERVVGPYLSEAQERYHMSDETVVRLCSCVGVPVKEWASGICLPRRINLSI